MLSRYLSSPMSSAPVGSASARAKLKAAACAQQGSVFFRLQSTLATTRTLKNPDRERLTLLCAEAQETYRKATDTAEQAKAEVAAAELEAQTAKLQEAAAKAELTVAKAEAKAAMAVSTAAKAQARAAQAEMESQSKQTRQHQLAVLTARGQNNARGFVRMVTNELCARAHIKWNERDVQGCWQQLFNSPAAQKLVQCMESRGLQVGPALLIQLYRTLSDPSHSFPMFATLMEGELELSRGPLSTEEGEVLVCLAQVVGINMIILEDTIVRPQVFHVASHSTIIPGAGKISPPNS